MPSREALDDFLARAARRGRRVPRPSDRGRCRRGKGPVQIDARRLRQRIDRGARDCVRQSGRSSRRPPVSRVGRRAERAQGVARLGTADSNPRRRRHAVLLRERPDPAMDRRTRSCRHRPSRDRRPRRSGDAGDADQVCAPLRHRQFDAGAAQPDRPVRPAADGQRTGRCRQGIVLRARGRNVCDRGISPVSVRRPAQGRRLAAKLRLRPRSVRRSAVRSHEPGFRTRRAWPDCRPGSSCGSRHPAPTPAAGSAAGHRRSETAASRR